MNDVSGLRCAHCDHLVRVTTYGRDRSYYRIVDELQRNGTVERRITLLARVNHIEVNASFRGAP